MGIASLLFNIFKIISYANDISLYAKVASLSNSINVVDFLNVVN